MSMSTHVKGIRPPNAEYKKKEAAWHACKAAGIEIPAALAIYFHGEDVTTPPNPLGMEVDLENSDAVTEYKAEMQEGFDVDVSKLPAGVTIVRFYNSY